MPQWAKRVKWDKEEDANWAPSTRGWLDKQKRISKKVAKTTAKNGVFHGEIHESRSGGKGYGWDPVWSLESKRGAKRACNRWRRIVDKRVIQDELIDVDTNEIEGERT